MKKSVKWGVVIVMAVGIAGGWYYRSQPRVNQELNIEEGKALNSSAKSGRSSSSKLSVNAVVIKSQLLVDEFSTTGVLIPDESVDLAFETAGKVVEILFEEGTFVREGDLLARINDEYLVATRARLTAQLKLANDRVYRQAELLERDAVSREALEQVQTDLAILQADIDIINAQIDRTKLRAPFDGVIGLRQISVGAYVTTTMSVATLTKNNPLKVEFAIPERYAQDIGKGANLTFKVEGDLNEYKAQVYAAESSVDMDLHQYTLRALYNNDNGRMMAGRYALVELKKDEIYDAIAIPAEAIVPEMGLDKVYLYKSGKAEPVVIKTGLRTEDMVQVVEGLSLADTMIVSGTLQLRTGLEVELEHID